jgi:hypothetical protein
MVHMKRFCLASAATIAAVVGLPPALATAQIVELGDQTGTALVAPSCPAGISASNCSIILTQATALATIRDGVTYPTTVTKPGYIVAFAVGLSNLSPNRATRKVEISYLDHKYGGTTRVAITVLAQSGPARLHNWTVVAQGPTIHVQPYLGEVVQFPLATALPVKPGNVVALTTPTWASVLSIDVTSTKFAYRDSRSTGCLQSIPPPTTTLTIGASAVFGCSYAGTRVEYSAIEITTPAVPKNYVHARDLPGKATSARGGGSTRSVSGGAGLP